MAALTRCGFQRLHERTAHRLLARLGPSGSEFSLTTLFSRSTHDGTPPRAPPARIRSPHPVRSIYYFSPGRQKFRSKPEVLKFLTGQSLPKGERKERGAGKSAAGPKTRADLYADAKKHLARCSQLPEVDRMRVNNLGAFAVARPSQLETSPPVT